MDKSSKGSNPTQKYSINYTQSITITLRQMTHFRYAPWDWALIYKKYVVRFIILYPHILSLFCLLYIIPTPIPRYLVVVDTTPRESWPVRALRSSTDWMVCGTVSVKCDGRSNTSWKWTRHQQQIDDDYLWIILNHANKNQQNELQPSSHLKKIEK